jgi:hypothetical protein
MSENKGRFTESGRKWERKRERERERERERLSYHFFRESASNGMLQASETRICI